MGELLYGPAAPLCALCGDACAHVGQQHMNVLLTLVGTCGPGVVADTVPPLVVNRAVMMHFTFSLDFAMSATWARGRA